MDKDGVLHVPEAFITGVIIEVAVFVLGQIAAFILIIGIVNTFTVFSVIDDVIVVGIPSIENAFIVKASIPFFIIDGAVTITISVVEAIVFLGKGATSA
ncbi:hypothetical protein DFO67_103271 [Modicisalibacter xianhensis]|uniref:Uncharacterized protein n=1 Tax=Modicisalibacter xianhensis TaxID=442341 RepID=A0A4R8G110_9GAMM|nr:hypothetical protein [Halomonas xianhensis]TDX31673.1 hypothetical protein DFO67_103271 [Halomonas xianhensis]